MKRRILLTFALAFLASAIGRVQGQFSWYDSQQKVTFYYTIVVDSAGNTLGLSLCNRSYPDEDYEYEGHIVVPATIAGDTVIELKRTFRSSRELLSVELPESIKEIYGAFRYCTGLTSVELPEGLEVIGEEAFYGCTGLTDMEFPEGLEAIGGGAFEGCTGLTSLEFPETLKIIGGDFDGIDWNNDGAFRGCTGLTDMEFPEGLEVIGEYAFSGCTGLTSIAFPTGLEILPEGAFFGCAGLTSVEFPEGLEAIGRSAFSGCTGLTSVDFPADLDTIGECAFRGCTGLTSIAFPTGLEILSEGAFYGCTGLTSLEFPENLKIIGYYDGYNGGYSSCGAFEGCTGLTSLKFPEGLETISDRAFADCTGLTSLEFPGSLKTIGDYYTVDFYRSKGAFEGCTGLTSLKFSEGLEVISPRSFRNCTGLTSLEFPESLKEIGYSYYITLDFMRYYGAFEGCTGLTSVVFPGSWEYIGPHAFYGCTRLSSVAFPPLNGDVTVCDGAFRGCDSLKEVEMEIQGAYNELYISDSVFPASVRNIKLVSDDGVDVTLNDLPNLERIEIDGGAGFVSTGTMSNCPKLKYAALHGSSMFLTDRHFSGDSSLEYIIVKSLLRASGNEGSIIPDLPNLKYLIMEAGPWPSSISSAGFLQEIVHLGADRYTRGWYDSISEAEVLKNVKVLSFVDTSGPMKFTGIDYRLLKVLNRHDTVYTYGQYPDLVVLPQPVSCRLEVDSLSVPVVLGEHALDSLDIWVDIEGFGKYKVPVEQDLSRYTGYPEPGPLVSYTIVKAPLRVVADTVRMRYGETVPELGYTMEGFVFGEDASVLESLPAVSCTAGSHPDAGTYPIEVSGGEAANYEFVYVPGLLIVEPASQEINWPQDFPQPVRVGEEVELQVSASSGLELSFDLSNPGLVSIEKRGARYMLTGVSEGVTDVTARQDGGRNYSAAEPVVKTIRVQGRLSNEEGEGSVQGRVYAKDRMLHFEGISGEVCVHTVAGTLVYQGEALPVSLPQPGVYIVRHGQQTEKVVVM